MSVVTETVWIHVVPGIGACVSITIIIVNLVSQVGYRVLTVCLLGSWNCELILAASSLVRRLVSSLSLFT